MPYLYYSTYDGQGYNEASANEFLPAQTLLNLDSSLLLGVPYWQGTDVTSARWKPTSHQIISPGFDAHYGYGGPYIPAGTPRIPATTTSAALPTEPYRKYEADNITNFSNGELQP